MNRAREKESFQQNGWEMVGITLVFEQRLIEKNRMHGYCGYLKFCAMVEKMLQSISSAM